MNYTTKLLYSRPEDPDTEGEPYIHAADAVLDLFNAKGVRLFVVSGKHGDGIAIVSRANFEADFITSLRAVADELERRVREVPSK